MSRGESKSELKALDGLRGIAILAVFFFHIATAGAFKTTPSLQTVALAGWLGVDLFFAMSGYLITRSAFSRKGKQSYFSGFYMSRARRILPVYVVALAIFVPLMFLRFPDSPLMPDFRNSLACLALFCSNMHVAMTSTAVPFGLSHFWSLAIEVQLYLVWPLLAAAMSRRPLMWVVIALALTSVVWRIYVASATGNWIWTYFSTPTRLDSFSWGALVYLLPAGRFRTRAAWPALFCGLLGCCLVWVANNGIAFDQPWSNSLGMTFAAMTSAALVLLLVDHQTQFLDRILSANPISSLGKISYSFYVFHFPLQGLRWYGLTDPAYKQFGVSMQRDIVMALALLSIAVLVSALSYRFIEKPFMADKKVSNSAPSSAPKIAEQYNSAPEYRGDNEPSGR